MTKRFFSIVLAIAIASGAVAQDAKKYTFTDVKVNDVSAVKDQASSGTCWSFAGIALVESELMKAGKGEHDLSEMWIARYTYLEKARNYARMHGNSNLSAGGVGGDVHLIIDKYGIVPEEVYNGLNYGTDRHQHGEIDAAVKAYMDAIIKNPNRKLSTAWENGLNGILDAYFGAIPENFTYKGKTYTPKSFAAEMGIEGSDYVQLTSFTHHPFNTQFVLEVPDNWSYGLSYNVPMEDLEATIDYALSKGYTVDWAADVSERGFAYNEGFSIVPAGSVEDMSTTEKARWTTLTNEELSKMVMNVKAPMPEKVITQQMRQEAFNNYETTDDHLMQIVGVAKDQDGKKFYKVKNSWGKGGVYGGYFYTSVPYVLYKTTAIFLNKNGVPDQIKTQQNIK